MTTLTVIEVAAELHLSRSMTTAYLRTGEIAGGYQVVPRGRWLVDEATFRRWQAERRATVDSHRIAPRSARSRAAQSRRRTQ